MVPSPSQACTCEKQCDRRQTPESLPRQTTTTQQKKQAAPNHPYVPRQRPIPICRNTCSKADGNRHCGMSRVPRESCVLLGRSVPLHSHTALLFDSLQGLARYSLTVMRVQSRSPTYYEPLAVACTPLLMAHRKIVIECAPGVGRQRIAPPAN
jgi:hypothetical protein